MSSRPGDQLPEAGRLPTGRLARTARVGGLVTGQGLRWAGMRTANRVRTPERAAAAQSERTAALVQQLVDQLGQMRGAAMKVGQMLSMVEFDGLPEDQRDELQRRRERIGEELDYELEAQNQRRIERRMRGYPFARVPRIHTDLSTRRVLVS